MNATPRTNQVPLGPLVGALGALILIVSLFLDWYEGLTAFTVFEFNDLLLLWLAVLTLAALAAAMGVLRTPVAPALAFGAAALALVVVVSQIVNHPPAAAGEGGPEKDLGIWLALAGSALMVAGALLSSVRFAIALEPRERGAAPGPPERTGRADEAPTVRDEPAARPPRP